MVELPGFLAVPQPALLQLPGVGIQPCDLVEPRVIVTSIMIMFGSFLPSPLLVGTTKFTRALDPTLLWNHYTNNPRITLKESAPRSSTRCDLLANA